MIAHWNRIRSLAKSPKTAWPFDVASRHDVRYAAPRGISFRVRNDSIRVEAQHRHQPRRSRDREWGKGLDQRVRTTTSNKGAVAGHSKLVTRSQLDSPAPSPSPTKRCELREIHTIAAEKLTGVTLIRINIGYKARWPTREPGPLPSR